MWICWIRSCARGKKQNKTGRLCEQGGHRGAKISGCWVGSKGRSSQNEMKRVVVRDKGLRVDTTPGRDCVQEDHFSKREKKIVFLFFLRVEKPIGPFWWSMARGESRLIRLVFKRNTKIYIYKKVSGRNISQM